MSNKNHTNQNANRTNEKCGKTENQKETTGENNKNCR